ncbi:hypothetical protein RIF29_41942 [Crotalaria pallida]|uniref:TIR domain-containing protein n=1 Tax=Crotalaria pallida TaxID=3830 RepID=A0AAN9HS41_CROPI
MACKSINRCSSSSSQMKWKYDVFVSFRGEDIRYNFIDHLFAAFVRKGIVAFRDDTTLEKGKSIFVELMQAIQASHVFIVVFSKNYAASTWCLDELARIVDCSKVTCQTTLPVFYDVTPSEVRKQSGDYGKALIGHEIIFKDDLDVVKRWRESLKHVAGLSGWDLQNKPQHGEIEKIIEKVRSILDCKSIEGIPSSQRWKHDMKMETYKTISSSQRRWKHDMNSLEVLNLYGCSKSFNNQLLQKERYTGHLKKVDISETTTLQYQSRYSVHKRLLLPFHCFRCRRHGSSVGLFPSFPCLRELDLSFCNLLKIPDAIGCLYYLEILNLGGNNFVGLPSSIKELPRLGNLNLQHCKELEYLFEDLYNVLPARTEPVCGNYKPGLYIFNCPKLVEMKSWSNMAVSWMIQVIKESSLPYPCVEVVIPGTQIPMWFNNQSVGDSIRIDEPFSFLDDSDWIGVSFCVAFVAYERDHPINLSCRKGHFEIECKFIHDCLSFSRFIPIVMARDLFEFELVHLYLVHFSREEFITILDYLTNGRSDGLDGIKLDVVMHIPAPRHWQHDFQLGVDLDVVSCGLRRVFYQELELEEMKPIMTNGGWTLSRITAS